MIENIIKKAKKLLEEKEVNIVIGYAEDSDGEIMAQFAVKPEDADKFIYDQRCVQNLAVYLVKGEVKKYGKACIIANLSSMRSILQISSENQLKEVNFICIGISDEGNMIEFNGFEDIEKYLASQVLDLNKDDRELFDLLNSKPLKERQKFWTDQLSKCIKCYACRASCPMCYCNRCQVEFNQPQIITIEATPMGNFEWHVMRAMHLAGRCVNCGECGRACPMEIPIHMLTIKTVETVKSKFDVIAGTKSDLESVMSNYKPDDKENFIKHE